MLAPQDAAERAVDDGLRRLHISGLEAALVAVDPRTGGVVAIVGGRDYVTAPFNRMRRTARLFPPRPFTPAPGLREDTLCRVSHLQPPEGCPTYAEYFKSGDHVPSRLCPIHPGTLRQRAERKVETFVGFLARRLRNVFSR